MTKEQRAEYMREYRKKHPESVKRIWERRKEREAEHPELREKRLAKAKVYNKANAEKYRESRNARRREKYATDPEFREKLRTYCVEYRRRNSEKVREKDMQYKMNNAEKIREYTRELWKRRKAREAENPELRGLRLAYYRKYYKRPYAREKQLERLRQYYRRKKDGLLPK